MIGLIVFGAALLYLLISIGVVRWAIRYARDNGKSAKRWGWGAALILYLIPFWDWIPTVVTHQYYCVTESGFWVYKTLDQWKTENPGVMETLVANKGYPSKSQGDMKNWEDTYFINQRVNTIFKKNGPFIFNRWQWEQKLVDTKNNEVLARYIGFSTGNGNIGGEPELRLWLHSNFCASGRDKSIKFGEFTNQFRGAIK